MGLTDGLIPLTLHQIHDQGSNVIHITELTV